MSVQQAERHVAAVHLTPAVPDFRELNRASAWARVTAWRKP